MDCKTPISKLKNPRNWSWYLWIQCIIIQLNYAISFIWSLATQINQENMLNMHDLRVTILDKSCKPWFCRWWFFELWNWNLIVNRAWDLLQCIRMVKTPWIALECKNQFSIFLEFLEIVWGLSAAFFTSMRLGFACIYIEEMN